MSYGTRLQEAMTAAKVDRKGLAKHLRMSVQAVGQVLGGKTKAFDAAHHTKAALFLECDALWLATGVRQAAAPSAVRAGEPPASYDTLPASLTTAERDLINALRSLPPRRRHELRDAILREATQFVADVRSVTAKQAVGPAVSAERAAETLPGHPDGPQPETVPGRLE